MDPTNGEDPLLPPPEFLLDQNGMEANDGAGGGGRGSIATRRAMKCGFRAEMINAPSFSSQSPHLLCSPVLTIPPGISPTALLESPILLPNSLPSPTTGSFRMPFYEPGYGASLMMKAENDIDIVRASGGFPEFPQFASRGGDLHSVISGGSMAEFEFPKMILPEEPISVAKFFENSMAGLSLPNFQPRWPETGGQQDSQPVPRTSSPDVVLPAEEHEVGALSAAEVARISEDGYNWRKYGQKQVKGSEYPRSYYKCTQPNCQVKKKIERSHHGQITEIIYKGSHNHPKPQPTRRTGSPDDAEDGDAACPMDGVAGVRVERVEKTSSMSVVTELSDPIPVTHGRSGGAFDNSGTPELSSTIASLDDNDDDGATQASQSVRGDADEEESQSKIRRIDDCMIENFTPRAVREPRVVVQIESEVDILDDGYRWRKYGQKVVKGNPNPRSYYKCTTNGCVVRKHVERSSNNLKFVITTYEGKHNHEVPAARTTTTSTHSAGGGNTQPTPSPAPNALPKAQPRVPELPHFDRKPLYNDYLRPPRFPLRNYTSEARLGASSLYAMNLPSIFPSTGPYSSFGCNFRHGSLHQPHSVTSLVPDLPLPMPQDIRGRYSLPLPNFEFNGNTRQMGSPAPLQQGQPLIIPKQEHNENMYEGGPSFAGPTNSSSSAGTSAMY